MSNYKYFTGILVAIGAITFSGCSDCNKSATEQSEAESIIADVKDESVAEVTEATVAEPVSVVSDGSVSVMIDGEPAVLRSDVDSMVGALLAQNGQMMPEQQIPPEAIAQMRSYALDQLTLKYLLEREAKKEGFEVSDAELDEMFAKVSGGMSMEDAAKGSGMPVEKFNEMVRSDLVVNKLLQSKVENLPEISDEQVKAKFQEMIEANPEAFMAPETVSASHILVSVGDKRTDEEAKSKIDDISQMLKEANGTNFVALAKEFSDCPSKEDGGSLGMFTRGRMVKEFEDAAFSQELGVIGEPVKTQFGYHIVRVDDRDEPGLVSFEDVKDMFSVGVKRERDNEVIEDFFKKLRDGAKIENLESAVYSTPVMAEPASEELAENLEAEATEAKETVEEMVAEAVEATEAEATEVKEAVEETAAEAVEATEAEATEVKETVEEKAAEAVEATEAKATEVKETVEEKAVEAVEATEAEATEVKEAVEEKAVEAVEATEAEATEVKEAVEETAVEAVEATEAEATEVKEAVEEVAAEAVEATKEAIADAVEVVGEKVAPVVEATKEVVSDAKEIVEEKIAGAVENTKEAVAEAVDAVEDKIEAPAPTEAADAAQ